ncbi:MAG: hypothetical protein ACLVHV_03410 [Oscillospiraceae bacterium]
MDLNAFTNAYFLATSRSTTCIFSGRASRRSWRINQTGAEGRSMQVLSPDDYAAARSAADGVEKLSAATVIEGNVSARGPRRHVVPRGYDHAACKGTGVGPERKMSVNRRNPSENGNPRKPAERKAGSRKGGIPVLRRCRQKPEAKPNSGAA